jgi:RNA polymerase sigma factor (sigma-70 family)
LTNEELALHVQQGDTSSAEPLWEQVKLLTFKFAGRFFWRSMDNCSQCGVTLDDLQQECFLAVMDAAQAYDPSSGFKFTAFLNFPLKNHFNALIGCRGHQKENPLNGFASLNEPIPGIEDEDITRLDALEDTSIDIPGGIEESDMQRLVKAAIKRLEPFSQYLIELYYYQNKTFDVIAQEVQMERDEIRKHHQNALKALKATKEIQQLKPFYVSHPEPRFYSQDPQYTLLWGLR